MSTRATYNIAGTVFYCHYDGYREGAAWRFANMINALVVPAERDAARAQIEATETRRGGAAFAFIRGNMDAEPAYNGSHEGHGDTEWRYDVEASPAHGFTVTAWHRHYSSDSWQQAAPMPLAEFVAAYGADFESPRICAMTVKDWSGKPAVTLATLDAARQLAEIEQTLGERYAEGNPNGPIHLGRAAAWRDAIEAAAPVAA